MTDDVALNLGAADVPILVGSYRKQALAGLAGLAIVIWVVSRVRPGGGGAG